MDVLMVLGAKKLNQSDVCGVEGSQLGEENESWILKLFWSIINFAYCSSSESKHLPA